jgi:ABC-type sulfate transport system permease component
MSDLPPRRRPPQIFQPRFTLSILYVFVFFFLFCLMIVAPALYEVWQAMPPGPEQEAAAERAARAAMGSRSYVALFAAVAVTAVGAYARVLPGLRAPR